MATKENLKAAFAGESQANRTYLAFAKKAEAEGKANIARLFRAVAEAETIHAHTHLRVMGGIGSTADNLKSAIAGEHYEFSSMYPGFLAEAEAAGEKAAVRSFHDAMEVEKVHHELYAQALAALEAGRDLETCPVYVCPVCGHTVIGAPPETCPVCSTRGDKYLEVK